MDGRIPEPVFPTCQRLVNLENGEDRQKQVEKQVDEIARGVAKELEIYEKRVMANGVGQGVMK